MPAIQKGPRRWRLVLAALLCVPIAMTVWLREPRPLHYEGELSLLELPVEPGGLPGGMRVEKLWHLEAKRSDFGGYSAILHLPDGRFMLYADKGDALEFALPGDTRAGPARFLTIPRDQRYLREFQDIESATRDPETGDIWLGYESMNILRRFDPEGNPAGLVVPRPMSRWPANTGAEAFVRLADGRFLVMNESTGDALLWEQDPRSGQEPMQFRYAAPRGMSVTDAAQLPDGRVLVLLRTLTVGLPPFRAGLALADPDAISADSPWRLEWLADLTGPLPRENYEGLDVSEAEDGSLRLWLVSDDNMAALQRTLLAEIRWDEWRVLPR